MLAVGVEKDGADGDAGVPGDGADGGAVESVFDETLARGGEDTVAFIGFVLFSEAH